jgi:predicted DNA binding CopG/RHH family protein
MEKADKASRRKTSHGVELEDDERQLQKDLEDGVYVSTKNVVSRRKVLQKAARSSLKKKPVTIRLMNMTIDQLKFMAKQQGMPYQTLANSILHKYVTGRLKERD